MHKDKMMVRAKDVLVKKVGAKAISKTKQNYTIKAPESDSEQVSIPLKIVKPGFLDA